MYDAHDLTGHSKAYAPISPVIYTREIVPKHVSEHIKLNSKIPNLILSHETRKKQLQAFLCMADMIYTTFTIILIRNVMHVPTVKRLQIYLVNAYTTSENSRYL